MGKSMFLRVFLVVLCCIVCSSGAFGDIVDLVVLLDVSESMFPYYDATVDYLLKDIIQQHLHNGDTFHLISFADLPEREIKRTMKTSEDVTAVLDRITLLHPLGQYTDLILALRYLYQYTSDLSLRTKKNILILTDGIHDPPPGSAYPAQTNDQIEHNRLLAKDLANKISREGWDVNLVEFPRSTDGVDSNGEPTTGVDIYDTLSDSLDVNVLEYSEEKNGTFSHEATGAPSLMFPARVLKGRQKITVPFRIKNYRNDSILVKLDHILYEGNDVLVRPVHLRINGESEKTLRAHISLPEMEKGQHKLSITLGFSDNLRVFPRSGIITYQYSIISFTWMKYVLYLFLILVLLFLLIRYIVIPLRITIITSSERSQYQKSSYDFTTEKTRFKGHQVVGQQPQPGSAARNSKAKIDLLSLSVNRKQTDNLFYTDSPSGNQPGKIPLSSIAASNDFPGSKEIQHYPIEMRVLGQNPLIGNRNIHWIGKKIHSIGGGNSSFKVFLYPVPSEIASLHFSAGKGFIFTPIQSEFFPDLKKPVNDCLNIPITLKTPHGEILVLFFHEWISPLERINRILSLTRRPGSKDYLTDL